MIQQPIPGQLASHISKAADSAYDAVAERWGSYPAEQIHFSPECLSVSRCMLDSLVENGHRASMDNAATFYNPEVNEHSQKFYPTDAPVNVQHTYLVLDNGGQELIADATWQQFLHEEKRIETLPKVLVGTREQVAAQAQEAGIDDPVVLAVWLSKSERKKFNM